MIGSEIFTNELLIEIKVGHSFLNYNGFVYDINEVLVLRSHKYVKIDNYYMVCEISNKSSF